MFGSTALYEAVFCGKVNCVRLLLSHPMIDVNIQYNYNVSFPVITFNINIILQYNYYILL